MNKRKCSLSLSPAETHCSARWQGDSRSLITYCKNYKTALAANQQWRERKPSDIDPHISPIISPDRNGPSDLPVRLLTAQIDIDTIIWSINSSCPNPTFLELFILKNEQIYFQRQQKSYICIILFNDKMISLMVHGRIKVVSITEENVDVKPRLNGFFFQNN